MLTYNDPVEIVDPYSDKRGEHGIVVGLPAKNCPLYTVEFGDGSSALFAKKFLNQLITITSL